MSLSARQKAFFLIALKVRHGGVTDLLRFLPLDEATAYGKLCENLAGGSAVNLTAVADQELKKLARPSTRNYLAEVHNDWLLELIKDESPYVIATVLRYLPAERVEFILDHLPGEVLASLPTLTESFETPAPLVELLRRRFEGLFEVAELLSPEQPFALENFSLLRATQIRDVFQELGYREIALGLSALPEMTKILVLNRLLPDDKTRVEAHVKRVGDGTSQRAKKAQVHLISKDVNPRAPDFFVKELGYLIFAKALLPRDRDGLDVLKYKMSHKEVAALSEAIRQYANANTEASVLPFRDDALAAIKAVLAPA